MKDEDDKPNSPDDEVDARLGPDEDEPAPDSAPDEDPSPDAGFDEESTEAVSPAPARPRGSLNPAGLLALVVSAAALAGVAYLIITRDSPDEAEFARPGDVAEVARQVENLATAVTQIEQRVEALVDVENNADSARSRLEETLRNDIDALRDQIALYDSLPPRVDNVESALAAIRGIEAGTRDALLLAEAEYYLKIANALLTLGGDIELAAVALGMADDRVESTGNPALNNVRQSISDAATALELTETVDIDSNAMLLASLARLVDSLPLKPVAGSAGTDSAPGEEAAETGAAGRAWNAMKEAVSGAVKVSRQGDEAAPLLLPGAEPLIRANLALQLQTARLALLRGQQSAFDQSLEDADAWLSLYFDDESVQVQSARATLGEVRSIRVQLELPDISEPLILLRQHEAVSESAP